MRQIKFRAWLKEFNIMETTLFGLRSDGMTSFNSEAILMQWTGLKDKNGVEIYEGDWCEAVFRDAKGFHVIQGQIIMDEYMWCLDNSHNHPECEIYSINRLHDFLVIGNVHEHPHLINQPA